MFSNFNEDSPHSSPQYIQNIPILTIRHQKRDPNKIDADFLNTINRELFDQPVIRSRQISPHFFGQHPLLGFITNSKSKISHKTKKKIIKIRNKNLNYYIKNTHDRQVILDLMAIKRHYKDKSIQDPTKSHVFSFICLALLRKYSYAEQFFNIFDHYETIRKNKRTSSCTEQEIYIIKQQMAFFKNVAIKFYSNPLYAILLIYLRNHSQLDIRHNQLDQYTVKGLTETIGILNSKYFRMEIDYSSIRPFLQNLSNRNRDL